VPGATGGQGECKLETASAAQQRSAGSVGVPYSNCGTGNVLYILSSAETSLRCDFTVIVSPSPPCVLHVILNVLSFSFNWPIVYYRAINISDMHALEIFPIISDN
jgi:hypothetical protein